jgi:predicted HicB family RNase H-like nuclease
MVIKKKKVKENVTKQAIDRIISKGGSITIESKPQEEATNAEVRFTLRIPSKLIKKIDESRKSKDIKISRNHWILEAISKAIK